MCCRFVKESCVWLERFIYWQLSPSASIFLGTIQSGYGQVVRGSETGGYNWIWRLDGGTLDAATLIVEHIALMFGAALLALVALLY